MIDRKWWGYCVWIVLLALCAACGLGGTSEANGDLDQAAIDRVRGRLDCNAQRLYCDALDRFAQAQAPEITGQPYSLLGHAYSAWTHEETVDWFVSRPPQMAFGNIIAQSPEETAQLAEVLSTLRAHQQVPATHPVAVYVRSLTTGGREPHQTDLRGRSRHYLFENGDVHTDVYVRQSASEILVVERNDSGATVGVFPR